MAPASGAAEKREPALPVSADPARGWTVAIFRFMRDFLGKRIMALAAGVTYYGLLAIFPAIAALVAVYGTLADPAVIHTELERLSTVLPGGAIEVIDSQVKSVASARGKTFSIAFVGGLAFSLWSASSGIMALFDALNIVYGERESAAS